MFHSDAVSSKVWSCGSFQGLFKYDVEYLSLSMIILLAFVCHLWRSYSILSVINCMGLLHNGAACDCQANYREIPFSHLPGKSVQQKTPSLNQNTTSMKMCLGIETSRNFASPCKVSACKVSADVQFQPEAEPLIYINEKKLSQLFASHWTRRGKPCHEEHWWGASFHKWKARVI